MRQLIEDLGYDNDIDELKIIDNYAFQCGAISYCHVELERRSLLKKYYAISEYKNLGLSTVTILALSRRYIAKFGVNEMIDDIITNCDSK